ncbi:2-(1,2-epoxy-1,2-dihydrophenyl)acetyl-CoA isomerase PaaG [Brevibacterium daeguense]|uniref:2-(1,2-epoxy-1,2-dihydrophenyl)acetyl-CoA isomerase PaaG n=1 Tax=Brevibacterium daeguense TaxID=909936 RepID=A0ABP8EFI0_9MICO
MIPQPQSTDDSFVFIDCDLNRDSGAAAIVLNRPEKRNAINFSVIQELISAIEGFNALPGVSSITITGRGKGFCAGDDIAGMGTDEHPLPDDPVARAGQGYVRLIRSVWTSRKPVIADVHGFAAGAGAMLMLAADIICVDPDTTVSFPFTKLGITAGSLVDHLGIPFHLANLLLYTGSSLGASDLARLGIAGFVGDPDERRRWVTETQQSISRVSPSAVQAIKTARRSSQTRTDSALVREQLLLAAGYGHSDYMEGKRAFLEKRSPNFLEAHSYESD